MTELSTRRAVFIIAAVATAAYVNSLWNGFAYDDTFIIPGNPRVHQLSSLSEILLTPYWPGGHAVGKVLGLYRPLTILGFALQWTVSGGAPWLFHATNVLLHTGVCVLVFLLIKRLAGSGGAVAGALVFAAHPVHTEAVANVVGQAEILSAGAVLAACILYVGRVPDGHLSHRRLLAIAGLYVLGMLAKEGAVVLPGLLVLLDVAIRRVEFSARGLARYAHEAAVPLATLTAVLLAYLILRMNVIGTIGGSNVAPSLPFLYGEHRRLSALRAWPEYARLLFLPADLSADYSPAVILPVESWTPMAALGGLLLAGTTVLTLLTAYRPALGLGAGWFLVAILPVSNLITHAGILVAERTLYLPSVAVAVMVAYAWRAWKGEDAASHRRFSVLAIALALMVGRTVVRNPDWKSTDTIFQAIERDHPESYRVHWQEATKALMANDTAASLRSWELAWRIWPHDARLAAEYGYVQLALKHYDRAIELFEVARPRHVILPEPLIWRGMAYVQTGRYEEALGAVHEAQAILGPDLRLFDIEGRAYLGLGRPAAASAALRAAIRRPGGDNWAIWTMLARALAEAGHDSMATQALRAARSRTDGDSTVLRRIDAYVASDAHRTPDLDSASRLQNAIGPAFGPH